MDVTCERCGTEYDFDETLVSDRGTTVKCTNCGHLFKVHRPGAAPGAAHAWAIRKRQGQRLDLSSLRDLQALISKGELTEDDEISRSGEAWKPLGAIAELQTFFAAARAQRAGQQKPRTEGTVPFAAGSPKGPFNPTPSAYPPGPQPGPGVGPARHDRTTPRATAEAFSRTQAQPAMTAPKQALPGAAAGPAPGRAPASQPPPPAQRPASQPPPPAQRPASQPPPAQPGYGHASGPSAATAGARPISQPPPPAQRPISQPPPMQARLGPQGSPGAPTAGARPSADIPAAHMATAHAPQTSPGQAGSPYGAQGMAMHYDDEAPVRIAGASRTGCWVAALVVLGLVGGGVALGWSHVAPLIGMAGDDPLLPFVDRGRAALALDHEAGYRDAIREFTRATALVEQDVRIQAGLADAHGALSQWLKFRAADLQARAESEPSLAAEAAALRREQEQNARDARRFAEDAVRQDANDLAAVLALCHALRLSGDTGGAQAHLDRARTLSRPPSGQFHYAAAMLTLEGSNLEAAKPLAQQAVQASPDFVRARLLLARAMLATADVSGARGEVDAVLAMQPEHPQALFLKDAMDRGLAPARPVVALVQATPDAGAAPADEDEPPAQAALDPRPGRGRNRDRPGGRDRADREPGALPPGRDYDFYINRGDSALERGDTRRAQEAFRAALNVRRSGSQALAGLGDIALGQGNTGEAVRRFRAAAAAGYAPAYIGLGDAYRRQGNTSAAITSYRRYLERRPSGPASSRARHHLEALEAAEGPDNSPAPAPGPPTPAPGPTTPPPGPPPLPGPSVEPSGRAPGTPPGNLPAPRGVGPDYQAPVDTPAVESGPP